MVSQKDLERARRLLELEAAVKRGPWDGEFRYCDREKIDETRRIAFALAHSLLGVPDPVGAAEVNRWGFGGHLRRDCSCSVCCETEDPELDLCGEPHPKGALLGSCTRQLGHGGPHVICTDTDHLVDTWGDRDRGST